MPRCQKCKAINDTTAPRCKRCGEILTIKSTAPFNQTTSVNTGEANDINVEPLWDGETSEDRLRSESPGNRPDDSRETTISGTTSVWEANSDKPLEESAFEQLISGVRDDSAPPVASSTHTQTEIDSWDEGVTATITQEAPRSFGRAPTVTGSVFMVRDSQEPPDRDIFLWLSRFLGFTLIIELIVLVFTRAYQQLGVILILGMFIALLLFSRLLGGLFLFALFGFARLLSPLFGSRNETVPVRLCRILDDQQQEYIVRIKGRIIRGDIDTNDRVAIWGRSREGTLHFRRGYNIRARSWIRLEGCYTWILALILGILNGYLLFELHRFFPNIHLGNLF